MPDIFNNGAPTTSTLTLAAYILLIVPAMLVGYVFARRKMFRPYHKAVMTIILIVNWVLIAFVMAVSYSGGVAPYLQEDAGRYISEPLVILPTIHLIVGALAQILGTYLVLRMWAEDLKLKFIPQRLMVSNIKRYMRLTLALWLLTAVLGIVTYFAFYPPGKALEVSEINPAATLEPGATVEPAAPVTP
jgi:uncharacterized membrane protein YozB (DUF420 family)